MRLESGKVRFEGERDPSLVSRIRHQAHDRLVTFARGSRKAGSPCDKPHGLSVKRSAC